MELHLWVEAVGPNASDNCRGCFLAWETLTSFYQRSRQHLAQQLQKHPPLVAPQRHPAVVRLSPYHSVVGRNIKNVVDQGPVGCHPPIAVDSTAAAQAGAWVCSIEMC